MADKYISIKKSITPQSLKNLASIEEQGYYLKINSANEAQANTILATLDDDDYVESDDATLVSGATGDSILVPRAYGK